MRKMVVTGAVSATKKPTRSACRESCPRAKESRSTVASVSDQVPRVAVSAGAWKRW